MIICPVCSQEIEKKEKSYCCDNGHSFDIAKEGYVNLLAGKHKSGSLIGDNKEMAKSRRNFLEKGYYDFLAQKIADIIVSQKKDNPNVLDISCGEGYYTDLISRLSCTNVTGFDISKEMVKLAAKKYHNNFFFVANNASIPIESESIDIGYQICAPFNEKEFSRILKKDGIIISVVPAKKHLWSLKKLVYDTPYENNEDSTDYEKLTITERLIVSDVKTITSNEEIMNLFSMTPYYYRTKDKDIEKLNGVESLETEFEFEIRIMKKVQQN